MAASDRKFIAVATYVLVPLDEDELATGEHIMTSVNYVERIFERAHIRGRIPLPGTAGDWLIGTQDEIDQQIENLLG